MKRILMILVLVAISLVPNTLQAQKTKTDLVCRCLKPQEDTSIAAFRAKSDTTNKLQNDRIKALQVSRTKMQKDIEVLADKLIDANNRQAPVDTSITNELSRHKVELAKIDSMLLAVSEFTKHQMAWNDTENNLLLSMGSSNAGRSNRDHQPQTGVSSDHTTRNWLIGGSVTAVALTTIYFIGRNSGWWNGHGGGDIMIHNEVCVGICR